MTGDFPETLNECQAGQRELDRRAANVAAEHEEARKQSQKTIDACRDTLSMADEILEQDRKLLNYRDAVVP